jgi:hypothetical protein
MLTQVTKVGLSSVKGKLMNNCLQVTTLYWGQGDQMF